MPRGSKKGGATWVPVVDRGEHKVRCLSCSLVVYPKDWWFHVCDSAATKEESSKPLEGQSSMLEDTEH
jgi:hypothetical protein